MKLNVGPPRLRSRSRSNVLSRSQSSSTSRSSAGWSGTGGSGAKSCFEGMLSIVESGKKGAVPHVDLREHATKGTDDNRRQRVELRAGRDRGVAADPRPRGLLGRVVRTVP